MERFADPVVHDERRHQAECERADRLAAIAEELADEMMMPGEEFDPYTYEWFEEVASERGAQMEVFCKMLRGDDSKATCEVMKAALRDYVRPQAYAAALDRVKGD